eukprot:TRINITY_DN54826_c0_g1_i1.p1 TRINITY_DN54826_c0_g1~~TRINITY_DN54826_c0_g1_i1.p1  ORF type:complete len:101 (+),score=28.42 TRINITY_DN54826_c0_g1_i1:60-362(+)
MQFCIGLLFKPCLVVVFFFFFFSSRRRHTRCREVSWARRCVQETVYYQSISVQSENFLLEQNKDDSLLHGLLFSLPCHISASCSINPALRDTPASYFPLQ